MTAMMSMSEMRLLLSLPQSLLHTSQPASLEVESNIRSKFIFKTKERQVERPNLVTGACKLDYTFIHSTGAASPLSLAYYA